MAAINVVESMKAIQYTGSNSAEIDAAIPDFTITSESGGVLGFSSNSASYSANTGDRIVYWQNYVQYVLTNSTYSLVFVENALASDVAALASTVDTLNTEAVRSVGISTAPTLLLNTPATVVVTLNPAMPDSSYTANVHLFGGVNLSSVTVNSVTVVDADTVDVSIQTSLVSLAGVQVVVAATD